MDQSRTLEGQNLLIQSTQCLIISLLQVFLPKNLREIIFFTVVVTSGACRIRLGSVNIKLFGENKKKMSLYDAVFSSHLFFFFAEKCFP
jgi:hypothetical protein